MTIEFIHTADIHIGLKNHGLIDPVTRENSRIQDVLRCLDYMIDYMSENKLKLLFIAGDVFHSKAPAIYEQVEFSKRLQRLNSLQIDTHILLGNHDVSNLTHKLAAVHIPVQLELDYIHVYREHGIYTTLDYSLLFLGPYVKQQIAEQLISEFIQTHPGTKFLFCHPLIEGSEYSSGVEAETIEEGWSADIFSQFPELNYIGMGHVHKHQVISKKPLALYSGSLSRCDFSEQEDKGFLHVRVASQKPTYKLIKTPTRDFISLSGTQEQLLEKKEQVTDTIVRLRVELKLGELLRTKELKHKYSEAFNVVLDPIRESVVDLKKTQQLSHFKKNAQLKDLLDKYFEDDPEKDSVLAEAQGIQLI